VKSAVNLSKATVKTVLVLINSMHP